MKRYAAVLALLPVGAVVFMQATSAARQDAGIAEARAAAQRLLQENAMLQERLEEAREDLLALEDINSVLRQEYRWLQQEKSGLQLTSTGNEALPSPAACCADTSMVLHFRSNSSSVEKRYLHELETFVDTVLRIEGAVVELVGHSDRRGPAAANLALSRERVAAVEAQLRRLGLQNVLVETSALGTRHARAGVDSAEGAFFDRRVEVRVRQVNRQLLSSTD